MEDNSGLRNDRFLTTLYTQNAETARVFWEWRHKVITIFFAAIGAVFILACWMNLQPLLRSYLWVPCLLGVVISLVAWLMEYTNTIVLSKCYELGDRLQKEFMENGGIFARIRGGCPSLIGSSTRKFFKSSI